MRTVVAITLALAAVVAHAAELIVFCPGAVKAVVTSVATDYERVSGDHVRFVFGTAGSVAKRVADDERGDVVITTAEALRSLADDARIRTDSERELGRMGVGVAVQRGAPEPDIGTPEAFRRTMLDARSIMYADPAQGGQSGIHVAGVMKRLGIADVVAPKTRLRAGAPDGLREVAAGSIEVGLGQISEILAEPGVVLVGPLPGELQNEIAFAAAVTTEPTSPEAAARFVQRLTDRAARERFRAAGFRIVE